MFLREDSHCFVVGLDFRGAAREKKTFERYRPEEYLTDLPTQVKYYSPGSSVERGRVVWSEVGEKRVC